MKFFKFLITALVFVSATNASAESVAPVKSKEDLQFVGKNEYPLLDLGKSRDYVGSFIRRNESSPDLKTVDLYTFKNIQAMKMDLNLCANLVASMFGPVKGNPLQFRDQVIFKGHTGATCEVVVLDPDRGARIPERRIVLGFINLKPLALVFRFSKESNASLQQATREFWATLR
ncbi:MAG: hypothetical protein HUU57_11295 [Bdellovibrio sp.]|nr:hypothetical protein [Bdellovibrio sp.]